MQFATNHQGQFALAVGLRDESPEVRGPFGCLFRFSCPFAESAWIVAGVRVVVWRR